MVRPGTYYREWKENPPKKPCSISVISLRSFREKKKKLKNTLRVCPGGESCPLTSCSFGRLDVDEEMLLLLLLVFFFSSCYI